MSSLFISFAPIEKNKNDPFLPAKQKKVRNGRTAQNYPREI